MAYWQGTQCNFQSLYCRGQISAVNLNCSEENCGKLAESPIQCRLRGDLQDICLSPDRLHLFIDYISRDAPAQRFELTFLWDPDNSAWESLGCVIKVYCKAQHLLLSVLTDYYHFNAFCSSALWLVGGELNQFRC